MPRKQGSTKGDFLREEFVIFKKSRMIRLVAAIIACICIGFIYAWSVLQTPLVEQHGWLDTKVTIAYTLIVLLSSMTSIIFCGFVKKHSLRTCIMLGAVLFGGGIAATAFAVTIWQLYLFYGAIAGFGAGFIYPQMMSYVVKLFPERSGLASGIGTAAYGSGAVIWAPVTTRLIDGFGLKNTFIVLGIIFFIAAFVAAFLLVEPPEGFREAILADKQQKEAYSNTNNQLEEFVGGGKNNTEGISVEINLTRGQMIRMGRFYLLAVIFICGLVAGVIMISQASPILQQTWGYPPAKAAVFVSVFAICNMAGRFLWGSMSDKIGLFNTATCVFALCILSMVGLCSINIEIVQLAAMAIATSCYGGFASILTPFVGRLFGYKYVTENFGVIYIVFGIASLIAPVLATTVKNISNGSYVGAYLVAAVLGGIGILLVQLLRRK